jgi:hypothetical protein
MKFSATAWARFTWTRMIIQAAHGATPAELEIVVQKPSPAQAAA